MSLSLVSPSYISLFPTGRSVKKNTRSRERKRARARQPPIIEVYPHDQMNVLYLFFCFLLTPYAVESFRDFYDNDRARTRGTANGKNSYISRTGHRSYV